jgi:hypothetical protein
MDAPSLPSDAPLPEGKPTEPPKGDLRLTPKRGRLILDLALLACIVFLVLWLGRVAAILRQPPQPPEPLPFPVVQERFARVHFGMPAKEVFHLLGPQRSAKFWEPEFDQVDAMVVAHPNRYPGQHYWAKWADPENEDRWVAVFISGGMVHHTLKKGF